MRLSSTLPRQQFTFDVAARLGTGFRGARAQPDQHTAPFSSKSANPAADPVIPMELVKACQSKYRVNEAS
ncbi:hypothetical protein GCM10007205_03330 [Oxalicibacterium flavum]|uniref:Uncharacterized protein n=1 Tax=Oxalicibacterium flavum TaxID=179467 RepID=A0A8J2XWN3_9BURK|nr:hypothetical protein GCM10007205_03330 [Oxalicibacterium flavum]